MIKIQKNYTLPELRERKNFFYIYFSVLNLATGKFVPFRIQRGLNKCSEEVRNAKAEFLIKDLTEKLENGWNPIAEAQYVDHFNTRTTKIKFNNYGVRFWANEYYKSILNMRSGTQSSYKTKLKYLVEWSELRKVNIDKLNKDTGVEFLDYCAAIMHHAPKTINATKSSCSLLFQFLIKKKVVVHDFFREIPNLKEYPNGQLPFNNFQVALLKNKLPEKHPQILLFCQFQYFTFIRPRELRFLKISDFDFEKGEITVRADISKNKKTMNVVIPQSFMTVLIENKIHLADQNHFVFTANGIPGVKEVSRDYFSKKHTEATKALKISDDYSLYSWKHTGNKNALNAGISVKKLQLQNRHSDLRTTSIYLQSLTTEDMQDVKEKFPEF